MWFFKDLINKTIQFLKGVSGVKKQTVTVAPVTVAPVTVVPVTTCNQESGYIYNNNDIAQPSTVNLPADCCALCRQTSTCVAWSFLQDYRLCYLKSAPNALVNRISYPNSFSGAVVAVVTTTTTGSITNTPVCHLSSGYIYPERDIGGAYLATPTDCCNRCAVTAGCVAWDYLNDSHYCFLKNSLPTVDRQVAYLNAYSGRLTP